MCGDQNNDYLRECDFFSSLLLLLLLDVSVLRSDYPLRKNI